MDGNRMIEGFYRNENGVLSYAPNFVFSDNYTLRKEEKNDLLWLDVFPIDGWYWFDSKEDAVAALGVDSADADPPTPPLPPIDNDPKKEKSPPRFSL
jgi:hypothetical protein